MNLTFLVEILYSWKFKFYAADRKFLILKGYLKIMNLGMIYA
jgi:hypothetical protein